MADQAEITERIRRFIAARDIPPSSFGRAAVSDPRLVGELRHGLRVLRQSTIDRIEKYIDEQEAK